MMQILSAIDICLLIPTSPIPDQVLIPCLNADADAAAAAAAAATAAAYANATANAMPIGL
jgi:hypothetical protein